MADTSLWPVVVGGLLTLGGIGVGLVATARRDAVQDRRDAKKRRADKFEELVAAVYAFDHWLEGIRLRDAHGVDNGEPRTVSPFAKVQAIAAVYFPQFNKAVAELDVVADQYQGWICKAEGKRLSGKIDQLNDGFKDAYDPYASRRVTLLSALKAFAQTEFQ
jgi:hypothetical protein